MSRQSAYLSEIFASYQGEGARVGQRHLFVRFAGCNIRCRYCDTPDSLTRVGECRIDYPDGSTETLANPVGIDRLSAVIERFLRLDERIAMVALTGGEPLVQGRFIARWLAEAPPRVGCLLETNALIDAELDEILPRIEVVSADLKLPSNSGEPAGWDRHRGFLDRCARHRTPVYVKMPIDDGTAADQVRQGARLVAECVPAATLYLQPVTDAVTGSWRLGRPRLMQLLGCASAELGATRFLPQMHKLMGIR